MTAIAYRDGIMAADTGLFAGDYVRAFGSQKIVRGPNGELAAAAGKMGINEQFRKWVKAGRQGLFCPGQDYEDFGAIIVEPSGVVLHMDGRGNIFPVDAPFHVQGGSEDLLIGALAAGASAEEAIRIAIKYSCWAAGDVQVERL